MACGLTAEPPHGIPTGPGGQMLVTLSADKGPLRRFVHRRQVCILGDHVLGDPSCIQTGARQLSVPAMGLTLDDRQPGSKVLGPTGPPWTVTSSICPLHWKGRTSSGASRLFLIRAAMTVSSK